LASISSSSSLSSSDEEEEEEEDGEGDDESESDEQEDGVCCRAAGLLGGVATEAAVPELIGADRIAIGEAVVEADDEINAECEGEGGNGSGSACFGYCIFLA
jgi:hypothetical protein